jgi:hypothetical protein
MIELKKSPANVFRRHPALTVILLLLLTWSWFYPDYRREMTRRPLDVPISISPPGEIRETIHIPLEEKYVLLIGFERNERDGEEWSKLLGDGNPRAKDKGIPIQVYWEISEKQKHALIKSELINTFQISGWEPTYVLRKIGDIKVPPGEYEVVVKLLQEIPEIKNPRARIVMELPGGKDSPSTPELTQIMWISILAIEPLMWGIEGLLTLILAIKMLRGT